MTFAFCLSERMLPMTKPRQYRPDKEGPQRAAYLKNKKRILATQSICGICGKPVDKSLKWPDPMAPVIDHIIPVIKGGHPSDISNMQLAHNCCNRAKGDSLGKKSKSNSKSLKQDTTPTNRNLPQSIDWINYRGNN